MAGLPVHRLRLFCWLICLLATDALMTAETLSGLVISRDDKLQRIELEVLSRGHVWQGQKRTFRYLPQDEHLVLPGRTIRGQLQRYGEVDWLERIWPASPDLRYTMRERYRSAQRQAVGVLPGDTVPDLPVWSITGELVSLTSRAQGSRLLFPTAAGHPHPQQAELVELAQRLSTYERRLATLTGLSLRGDSPGTMRACADQAGLTDCEWLTVENQYLSIVGRHLGLIMLDTEEEGVLLSPALLWLSREGQILARWDTHAWNADLVWDALLMGSSQ